MKSLGLVISALLLTVSVSAQSGQKMTKEPFAVKIGQLSKYLELAPSQINEVASITEFFIEKQNESLRASESRKEKKMEQAVYGNLKLMKKALTADQYRKYIVLLNVTNNNNRALGIDAMPDVFLADNLNK